MNTPESNTTSHSPRWAQTLSDIFSPLLVPTYGMIMAMWLTPLRSIPEENRIISTLMIAFITGALPLAALVSMMKAGKITSRDISVRSQRIVPMAFTALCYAGAGFFLGYLGAPLWLRLFFFGAAVATVLAALITWWWKISAHATALGGLTGMMTWCSLAHIADVSVMIVLSVVFIIVGLTATARVALGRHSIAQVAAGAALGFITCFACLQIFN